MRTKTPTRHQKRTKCTAAQRRPNSTSLALKRRDLLIGLIDRPHAGESDIGCQDRIEKAVRENCALIEAADEILSGTITPGRMFIVTQRETHEALHCTCRLRMYIMSCACDGGLSWDVPLDIRFPASDSQSLAVYRDRILETAIYPTISLLADICESSKAAEDAFIGKLKNQAVQY